MDENKEDLISGNDRIRHTFETQGSGPAAEQLRVSGEVNLMQQSNEETEEGEDELDEEEEEDADDEDLDLDEEGPGQDEDDEDDEEDE